MPLLSLIASKLKVTSVNGPSMCLVARVRRLDALPGRSLLFPPDHSSTWPLGVISTPTSVPIKIQGDPWVMASQWTVTRFNKERIRETEAGVGGRVPVGYARHVPETCLRRRITGRGKEQSGKNSKDKPRLEI